MKLMITLLIVVMPLAAQAETWLKSSTAATVVLGPFVDSVDGVTSETAISFVQADIRLSKNGGTFAQKNSTGGVSHLENGHYSVSLDSTDTNTLGRLRIAVNKTGALPIWQDFMVVPAATYDTLVAGTVALPVNVTQFGGSAGTFNSGRPDVNATHWGGTAVASANVRADVRQVDGSALSTHGSGQLPADVRQFGGTNGFFVSGRPEVTTSVASNQSIAAASGKVVFRGQTAESPNYPTSYNIIGTGIWATSSFDIKEGQAAYAIVRVLDGAEVVSVSIEIASANNGVGEVFPKVPLPDNVSTEDDITIVIDAPQLETIRIDAAAARSPVLFTGIVENDANSDTEIFIRGGGDALPAEVSGKILVITHNNKLYVREIIGFTGGGDALEVASLPFTPSPSDAVAILAAPP